MKKKILIADDECHIRRILQFNLERAGYEVLVVEDGSAALETALAEHPDLVILDISMPGMTGLDVCRKLKTTAALERTPVFLLTAKGQESDRHAGDASGADRFFTKPFSPKELVRELQSTLGDA